MIKNMGKKDNLFFVEISDYITKEDVNEAIPLVEEIIEKYKKMKCLIILNDVKGYTLGGFLADFNFYLKQHNSFDYVAIVGDKEFEKGMVDLFDKLMPGKAQYFDILEVEKAQEWIQEK